MKKLLLLTTFAFFLFTFSLSIDRQAFSQEHGWTDLSANIPTEADLSDVFFVSDNEGWITSSSHAEIYHTTDSGATFEIQTTQYTTNAIYMIDENEGYAGGAQGRVYRTTDGGDNWIAIGSMGATIADISFPPNGDTGYCCGIDGTIGKITPGGVSQMTSNVNGNLYSISFPVNSEEGWVCGGDVIRHYANNTWNGDQDYPSGGYNAIYMFDALNGWVVGDGGIIAHTEDGMNWFEQTNPDPENQTLYNVYFLNNNEGWAVGLGSQILHTTNGGNNWNINIEGNSQLNAIYFTSPTNGYVVGNQKTLLKYTEVSGISDGIETWLFEIFPNPAKDKCKVKSQKLKAENATIELFDLHGRKLLEKQVNTGTEEIEVDVTNLPSGVYSCRLIVDKKSTVKKLIIQK